ncbi:survival protein surA precursor [Buchnera aphidicola str. APS (Acyrthosiphon pisum)]|uniref:Chaperone SurA n=1 Tax=Buchnera aphidicola subsp. Acyrthosiphon pisum (strain APS) TaxID=107806 RepID=SURA_BUCAI|nr:peptidylprolyl isomerase [Buchnera aphidicola]P57240.1 RecName: Full=Chaperone SurA; AltName: Full=Peptidyl-prolyl cis-trans isomerase SurA; Short=PPIase SurA; AltName: Full=Rotamase SurA; Flags: Precursor [Buchnera aphidicola str. APS (Acyrthosiphon pisum)]pir/B84946/ peptidylprolyl isomerase (EC 5.2.1.8) surA [imported] - Buchnera sp. (strain APS) [Buchnera sp. (in: enterobacteria)]BAB12858.1 survival protein surA precursor [Buchnera aphidicola str. APS (Acyrthosiphon pisum)]
MKICIFIFFYIFSSIFYVLAKNNQVDNITAIVNDEIILNSDVNEILVFLKKSKKKFIIPLKSDFLKEKVLEKLIVDSLILQEANSKNINITKEQIDTVIKNIALKKHISVDHFKKQILLRNIKNPSYYDNFIKKIEILLKMKTIQDYELHKRINISEQEVNTIFKKLIKDNEKFKKINLSYILLPSLKQDSDNAVRNRTKIAENIVYKLKKGYDFEKLLIECEKNKSTFIVKKMFWKPLLDIQNSFFKTLNIFKKGQILGPIVGDKGLYILKVNDIHHKKENIVTEFYMQHCLIKPSVILTNTEAKKKIFNIYENIKKGIYTFDDAVKNLSDDYYSSNKKGDLGWISKESLGFDLNKKFLILDKNEISEPVKSNWGWHIFKILDRRQVDAFYKLKKNQAFNIVLNQKIISEKNHWIEDLKNTAYIEIIRS